MPFIYKKAHARVIINSMHKKARMFEKRWSEMDKQFEDVARACKQHRAVFNVLPLEKLDKKPITFVLDRGEKDEEAQFVVVKINKDGSGEFFDPYGQPPSDPLLNWILTLNCPRGVVYNTQVYSSCIPRSQHCVNYLRAQQKRSGFFGFLRELRFIYAQRRADEENRSVFMQGCGIYRPLRRP